MRPSCYIVLYFIMRAGDCKLGVAGKIMTTEEAQACLDAGMDFVLIGRGAILHHNYPLLAMSDPTPSRSKTSKIDQGILEHALGA